MTATIPATLPTDKDLASATRRLRDAEGATVTVFANVARVSRFQGDRAPTFEDIGRLHTGANEAGQIADDLSRQVEAVRDLLSELDYVRAMGNVDPEADRA